MTTFENVTVEAKANVYFDGKVVSHTVIHPDGQRKTVGLIYPGTYHFGTAAPERMDIISGDCSVVLDGNTDTMDIDAGSAFEVPGNSGFTITVKDCICEYICSFLSE